MKNVLIFVGMAIAVAISGCVSSSGIDLDSVHAGAKGDYDKSIKILEEKGGSIDTFPSADLTNLCLNYLVVGRFNKLEKCMDEMERRIDSGNATYSTSIGSASWEASLEINLFGLRSEYLFTVGKYKEVIDWFEKFLASRDWSVPQKYGYLRVGGKVSNWSDLRGTLGSVYLRLALLYYRLGDMDKARKYLEKGERFVLHDLFNVFTEMINSWPLYAGEGQKKRDDQRDWLYWMSMISSENWGNGLGNSYLVFKEYEKAEKYLKKLMQEFKKKRGALQGQSIQEYFTKSSLDFKYFGFFYTYAKTLYELGLTTQAQKEYLKVLSTPHIQSNSFFYWNSLFDLGRIALAQGSHREAIHYFKQTIEVIEQQRSTLASESTKIGFVSDKQQVYLKMVAALIENGQYEKAFSYAERAKSRALVDLLASKKVFKVENPDRAGAVRQILEEMQAAERRSRFSPHQQEEKNNTIQMIERNRGIAIAQKNNLSAIDQELASLVSVTPPNAQELKSLIPPGETLLEYYGTDDELFAFVVDNKAIRGMKINGNGLSREVRLLRKKLTQASAQARSIHIKSRRGEAITDIQMTGRKIYEKIISPVLALIKTSNITIVPHGVLHYLPFGALYNGRNYLLDEYKIRVLPSASVMPFLKDRANRHPQKLLALGNPDLDDPALNLPGAEEEALAITKIFSGAKLFTGKQATETLVKTAGGDFQYLHFATHGIFNPEKPLTSGLLLSGDGINDGTLTVSELYEISLPADLVTLSACETALGRISSGDDVVGFTRGFLYAGASSIVSSLWKVDDAATSQLMQQFYDNLAKNDTLNALRDAQLHIKNNYNPHPYYWAAFQLTGKVQNNY